MSVAPTRMNLPSRGRPLEVPQMAAARPQTPNAVAAQILASLPLPSGAPPSRSQLALLGLITPGALPTTAAPGETSHDVMRAYLAANETPDVEALMEPDNNLRRTARDAIADDTGRPAPLARAADNNTSPESRPTGIALPLTVNRPVHQDLEADEENRRRSKGRHSAGGSTGSAQPRGSTQPILGHGAAAAGLLLGVTVLILIMILLS